jgi:hypothetical protein
VLPRSWVAGGAEGGGARARKKRGRKKPGRRRGRSSHEEETRSRAADHGLG